MRHILLAGVAAAFGLAATAAQAATPSCDSACLVGHVDRYVDAMVKQQPDSLPWAETVRYSEDGVSVKIGDALWGAIRDAKKPAMHAADPSTGNVAWFGIIEEHGDPAYLALRLKIVANKIAEVEAILSRTAAFGDAHPFAPNTIFRDELPAAGRLNRARLIGAVNAYLDTTLHKNGVGPATVAPDCVRQDNGKPVDPALGKDCGAQLKLAAFSQTDRIRARAFPIVDEARGVVVVTGVMDFSARSDTYKTTDGVSHKTATTYPESQAFVQMFKIGRGGVQRIETVYTPVPYLMPSPWTR
jgi:hypothetical protein